MDALTTLLHDLLGPPCSHDELTPAAHAQGNGYHVITLDGQVPVTLCASVDADHWLMTTSPGYLNSEAQPHHDIAWPEAPGDEDTQAHDRLFILPADGQVLLQRCIERPALDRHRLIAELHHCLQKHRHWETFLGKAPA